MTRPNRRRVVTSLPIIILAILLAIVFMQKCEPRNEAGKMTPGTNNPICRKILPHGVLKPAQKKAVWSAPISKKIPTGWQSFTQ